MLNKVDAIICTHCELNGKEIYEIVYTKADNIFQFMCKNTSHSSDEALTIHAEHIFSENKDIEFFKFIDQNFFARRRKHPDGWEIRFVNVDEVPEDYWPDWIISIWISSSVGR